MTRRRPSEFWRLRRSMTVACEPIAAHLAEIGAAVDSGAYAVLMLDQAGWHISAKLVVPDDITLLPLPLPLRSPEPIPVEKAWQFMRRGFGNDWVADLPDSCSRRKPVEVFAPAHLAFGSPADFFRSVISRHETLPYPLQSFTAPRPDWELWSLAKTTLSVYRNY